MATEIARRLRKTMTRQEVKLWVRLRELREMGFHFRRQSPIPCYVVDFESRRRRLMLKLTACNTGSMKIESKIQFATRRCTK